MEFSQASSGRSHSGSTQWDAGTNNLVVLIKLQPNVAWTVPFKETPVEGCRRGQERSGDITPKCSVPPNNKLVLYSTNA